MLMVVSSSWDYVCFSEPSIHNSVSSNLSPRTCIPFILTETRKRRQSGRKVHRKAKEEKERKKEGRKERREGRRKGGKRGRQGGYEEETGWKQILLFNLFFLWTSQYCKHSSLGLTKPCRGRLLWQIRDTYRPCTWLFRHVTFVWALLPFTQGVFFLFEDQINT